MKRKCETCGETVEEKECICCDAMRLKFWCIDCLIEEKKDLWWIFDIDVDKEIVTNELVEEIAKEGAEKLTIQYKNEFSCEIEILEIQQPNVYGSRYELDKLTVTSCIKYRIVRRIKC